MEKFKFEKDGMEKECHCHEGVYEQLLKEGWKPVTPKPAEKTNNELDRDKLKAEADCLDVVYPKNIKTEKLYQLVFEAKANA